MTQRRLRLGDVLDDYCPRERRITNHAVVAMIEDTVKQTRCTTCDAEHEYKKAKVPAARRRKTGVPAAQLVEGAARAPEDTEMQDELPSPDDAPDMADTDEIAETADAVDVEEETGRVAAAPAPEGVEADADALEGEGARSGDDRDEWPVHRPLIRAQLPRPEGHVPERKAPDFTIRQGGKFDANRNGQRPRGHRPGGRQAQGQGQPGQNSRFGGPRGQGGQGGGLPGQRHGNRPGQGGGGNRPGQGQGRGPRPGGGRKRGR